ncbi:MAG: hypothetical protein HC851_23210 [Acaryochloris sp. RU_4_1]|nr:hypothetical protein [Acaryochloris sp. RU_4_1]NJN37751.1 hypothetical protein [Acaryochloridaceae cyanobacterium CSU_3_4]NJR57085.1 hypothetical protein [Acaryochloris sp. CRU_2_0]
MVKIGVHYSKNSECQFRVWAPLPKQIALKILSPHEKLLPMQQTAQGYWQVTTTVEPGTCYVYQLNGHLECPDLASQFQPDGVHGASEVFDHQAFVWSDTRLVWRCLSRFHSSSLSRKN